MFVGRELVVGEVCLLGPGRVACAVHLCSERVARLQLVVCSADGRVAIRTGSTLHRSATLSDRVHMACVKCEAFTHSILICVSLDIRTYIFKVQVFQVPFGHLNQ